MNKFTLLLNQKEIQECISDQEIFNSVDEVFRGHGEGKIIMPAKITLDMESFNIDSWLNAMPAYVSYLNAAGIKWAGGFIHNPKKGLSYVMATIILNDSETGYPLSIMDGIHITNIRTGAAAALSAKYLANKDSEVVCFIGAGMQAKTTLQNLYPCFDIKEVRISDINPKAMESFKTEMEKEFDIKVVITDSNKEAAKGSDIIYTATQADEPLLMNDWIKKGATVVTLGSYQELDEAFTLTADKILVDDWAQCSHRGELSKLTEKGLITKNSIYSEIGDVAAGKKVGRESKDERILVVPIGLGSHDVAVASKVYKRAMEKGIGTKYNFWR